MWLFTTDGFYSGVQHRTEPDTIVVRTRVKADAEHLAAWLLNWQGKPRRKASIARLIVTRAGSDYPWRVMVPREAWAQFAMEAAYSTRYDNYKSAVLAKQGRDREAAYHDVWAALLRLERDDPDNPSRRYEDDEFAGLDDWLARHGKAGALFGMPDLPDEPDEDEGAYGMPDWTPRRERRRNRR